MAVDVLFDEEVVVSNETPFQVFQTATELHAFPTANTPHWCKTQALAITLGYATKGDGFGALYYWDPDSTAADFGPIVVKPTTIATSATLNPTGSGRWLILACCMWRQEQT